MAPTISVFSAFAGLFAELKFGKYMIDANISAWAASYDFAFQFKNGGENSIKIPEIKTDCGCTAVNRGKNTYAPDETGEIAGTFEIGDQTWMQEKRFYIKTENIGQPEIELLFKAKIDRLPTIKPSMLNAPPSQANLALNAQTINLLSSREFQNHFEFDCLTTRISKNFSHKYISHLYLHTYPSTLPPRGSSLRNM